MREQVIEAILAHKIIAIVRGMKTESIVPLAEALYAGGIRMMEVTFNHAKPETFSETLSGIRALSEQFSGRLIPGAGTVLTPEQVALAAEAGAQYIVSPNVDAEVIAKTRALGLVSLPGAMTPSECVEAHQAGADFIKLFPLGSLGADYLKAIRAPLSHLRFLAVGGVNEKNAADFMKAGALGLGIGGNLVNKAWIDAGEFEKITALARELVTAVQK